MAHVLILVKPKGADRIRTAFSPEAVLLLDADSYVEKNELLLQYNAFEDFLYE